MTNFNFPYSKDDWINKYDMCVENYHKHTTWSNFFQIDSTTSLEQFLKKIDERHGTMLFSGEHGFQGEWLKVWDLCRQTENEEFRNKLGIHNPIKFRYSSEIYWVKDPDPYLKDNTNCHMVVVARTEKGIRQLNYLISEASDHGYYYRPRVGLEQILSLDPEDVYICSACLAGWKYNDADDIWLRIADHFGDSFFFEYQSHNTDKQKRLNAHIYDLSQKHGIQTIIGLDTHYIDEEDRVKRDNLLKRKGIFYEDEVGWYMDYPTGKELHQRMVDQNIIPKEEIANAMMNTHVFRDGCEEFDYDTGFKIPILDEYKNLSYEERANELAKILNTEYLKEPQSQERKDGIAYEFGQIKDSQTADYFLDNYRIIKNAIDNHGGQLTTTSRGSAASYYCSKLCGFTTIDRFNVEVPIYPERFITKERILSAHQMPD